MAEWITLQDVKLRHSIDTEDTGNDRLISETIQKVQAAVEQQLFKAGQLFGTFSNIEEQLTAEPYREKVFIEQHPSFDTLVSVVENGATLTEDVDFYARANIGLLIRAGGYWCSIPNSIVVTYSVTVAVPEDIKLAINDYVGVVTGLKKKTFVTKEGINETVAQGIPALIQKILDSHKVPRFIMHNA